MKCNKHFLLILFNVLFISDYKMYSLIEFAMNYGQKPEVEVVPNIWLEKEEEIWYCLWPQKISTKQIRKAIEKCSLPEKNWKKYKCRILHTYETDVELHEDQRPKRRLKRPRIYSDSSESDNNEEVLCNKIPSLPALKITSKNSNLSRSMITSCQPSTSTADSFSKRISNGISFSTSSVRAISPPQKTLRTTLTSSDERAISPQNTFRTTLTSSEFHKSDFSYVVLTKLVNLETSMNLLLPMVKQLTAHFRSSRIPHVEDVPEIPVDTDESLENIERFLKTKQNFEYMVQILAISGGTTIAQITRRTLEKIITNNYAKNFNWAGRVPKKAFKVLKAKDLIIATVRNVEPNAAVNKIENCIKDWLKLSSMRITLAEIKARRTFQQE
ncbi:uncharacterized protein [Anoplolepis gracilipes]|uniref:uncharacterized protein isoform X2 n=1 Tax=Anoplolepis gracilipes TaxID=354296 RepID=UPI003B9DCDFA